MAFKLLAGVASACALLCASAASAQSLGTVTSALPPASNVNPGDLLPCSQATGVTGHFASKGCTPLQIVSGAGGEMLSHKGAAGGYAPLDSASHLPLSDLPALTGGDAYTAPGSGAITLNTIANSPGAYPKITFNAKGQVTGGGPLASTDITAAGGALSSSLGTASSHAATDFVATAGDASATTILSTGSTTARGAAKRAADVVNVLDWGAVCNGTADDAPFINAALAHAAGKVTYLPNTGSACIIGSQLEPPSNSHLTIDGTLKLKPGIAAGSEVDAIYIDQVSNVIVDGSGVIDGNRANQTSAIVYSACIETNDAFYVRVTGGLTIQNCWNWPINAASNGAHIRISDVYMLNSGDSAECAADTDDCWFDHVYVSGIGDYGIALYGGQTHGGITNSYVTNCSATGLVVLSDGGAPAANSDLLIAGNTVTNSVGLVSVIGTPSAISSNVTIANNVGDHNGNAASNSGAQAYGGEFIQYASHVISRGNLFNMDGKSSYGSSAIYLGVGTSYFSSIGDDAHDEGQGSALGLGINAGIAVPYLTVKDFSASDDQSTHTMQYATTGSAGAGSVIQGVTSSGLIAATPDALTRAADTASYTIAGQTYTFSGLAAPTQAVGDASNAVATDAFVSRAVPPGAWTPYTATVTCSGGGSPTTTPAERYQKVGRIVFLEVNVNISALGSCTGTPVISLPFAAAAISTFSGRENTSTGKMLQGLAAASSSTMAVWDYTGASIAGAGYTLNLSGSYESTN